MRARASGCSTCSSCCSSSATTSPRSGSARSSTPTPSDDGVREDVRARQGGAAQPRRPDRGRQHGRATSTTSRATGSAPTSSRCPRSSSTADEAAVDRPGHPGLGARPAGRGDHRGGRASSRRPGVAVDVSALDIAEPRLSADEPSFDVFWEATQRAHRRSSSTTAAPAQADGRHPAPPAVGRRPLLRAAGTSSGFDTDRGDERVFRLSRVAGRGPHDRPARRLRRSRPAPTSARSARRLAPAAADRARRSCWSAAAPAPALRRGAADASSRT